MSDKMKFLCEDIKKLADEAYLAIFPMPEDPEEEWAWLPTDTDRPEDGQ